MKKTTVLGIIGGTFIVAGAAIAWIKREAIKESVNSIVDEVQKRLKKEPEKE